MLQFILAWPGRVENVMWAHMVFVSDTWTWPVVSEGFFNWPSPYRAKVYGASAEPGPERACVGALQLGRTQPGFKNRPVQCSSQADTTRSRETTELRSAEYARGLRVCLYMRRSSARLLLFSLLYKRVSLYLTTGITVLSEMK